MKSIVKRLMLLALTLVMALTCLTVVADGSPYADVTREPKDLHWASGNSAGAGYITGSVMASVLPEYYDGYLVIPEVTTGGVANAKMLLAGEGDFISMQSDDAQAFNKNERDWVGMDECTDRLRMVCVFSQTCFQLIANADDDSISSFADLKGKKVGCLAGSTKSYALQYLLQVYGMTEDDFADLQDMGRSDLVTAFKNGAIDFILDVTPLGNSAYSELAYSGKGIKLLTIDDEHIAALRALNGAYLPGTIAEGAYNGTKEAQTLVFYNLYLTDKDMPEYVVYDVVKCMYEHNDDLKAAHPNAGMNMDKQVFLDNSLIELHPGAAAFYKEIGWID